MFPFSHSICRGGMLVACAFSSVEQCWAMLSTCLLLPCFLMIPDREADLSAAPHVFSKKDFASAMERFKQSDYLDPAWPSLSQFGFRPRSIPVWKIRSIPLLHTSGPYLWSICCWSTHFHKTVGIGTFTWQLFGLNSFRLWLSYAWLGMGMYTWGSLKLKIKVFTGAGLKIL